MSQTKAQLIDTLVQPITGADGTQGAPTFSFTNDTDTGLFRPGDNQVAISTGGTQRLLVENTGLTVNGTTTLNGTTLSLGAEGGANGFINTPESLFFNIDSNNSETGKVFVFAHNDTGQSGSELLRIQDDGKVGIGTNSPGELLTVAGTTNPAISIVDTTNNTDARIRTNDNGDLILEADVNQEGAADSRMAFRVDADEKMCIQSTGLVGIGTTNPSSRLTVVDSSSSTTGASGAFIDINNTDTNTGVVSGLRFKNGGTDSYKGAIYFEDTAGDARGDLIFATNDVASGATEVALSDARMTITRNGNVGVGTTTPGAFFHVQNDTTANTYAYIENTTQGNAGIHIQNSQGNWQIIANADLRFRDQGNTTDRMRLDNSGRLVVGASGNSNSQAGSVESHSNGVTGTSTTVDVTNPAGFVAVETGNTANDVVGYWMNHGSLRAGIGSSRAATNNWGTDLRFYTHKTNASDQFEVYERMRILPDGDLIIGRTSDANSEGITLAGNGFARFVRDSSTPLVVNRQVSDGVLVSLQQAGAVEGDITVNGGTVSFNGAHLSRWSQLPGGGERIEILRGSVLSNIDEMCEWGEEDNEQHNRMKVSDVEGDKNVAGVFQGWDDDDDTYTNDFYCAMTGDFVIRIAQGVTVERGDLLMSAGDGTAKPQEDDVIRSKTIAKVTSTNVSCTYDDGSYCVPCVLMAC